MSLNRLEFLMSPTTNRQLNTVYALRVWQLEVLMRSWVRARTPLQRSNFCFFGWRCATHIFFCFALIRLIYFCLFRIRLFLARNVRRPVAPFLWCNKNISSSIENKKTHSTHTRSHVEKKEKKKQRSLLLLLIYWIGYILLEDLKKERKKNADFSFERVWCGACTVVVFIILEQQTG